jgi:hypothetical protein
MANPPVVIRNPTDFAKALLGGLGAPNTTNNQRNILSWYGREGGNWDNSAKFNPLNTSLPESGSTNYNTGQAGAGVQAYGSWQQGVDATVATLTQSNPQYGYQNIIDALDSNANYQAFGQAVQSSSWDANHYAQNPLVGSSQVQLSSGTDSGNSAYTAGATDVKTSPNNPDNPGKGNANLTGFAGILQQLNQYYNPNLPSGFSSLVHIPTTINDTATMIFVRGTSALLSLGLIVIGVKTMTSNSSAGGSSSGNVLDFINDASVANQKMGMSNLRLRTQQEQRQHTRARQAESDKRSAERAEEQRKRHSDLLAERDKRAVERRFAEVRRAKKEAERLKNSKAREASHQKRSNKFAATQERHARNKERELDMREKGTYSTKGKVEVTLVNPPKKGK